MDKQSGQVEYLLHVCVCVCRLLHSEDSETCRLNIPVSSFPPTTNRGFVKHWGRIHLLERHGIVSRRVAVPVVCNAETHAAAVTFNFFFSLLSSTSLCPMSSSSYPSHTLLLLLPLSLYFVTNLYSSFFLLYFLRFLFSFFPFFTRSLFCTN